MTSRQAAGPEVLDIYTPSVSPGAGRGPSELSSVEKRHTLHAIWTQYMHSLYPPAGRAPIQMCDILECLAGHAARPRLLVRCLLLGHGAQQRVPDVGADTAECGAEGHEDGGQHGVESWEE